MDAQLAKIKGGWAAVGRGWAVFGVTRDDALQRFAAAEATHEELRRQGPSPSAPTVRPQPSEQSPADAQG